MITTEKSESYCISHRCSDCNKELRREMSGGEKLFLIAFAAISLGSMFILTPWQTRISDAPMCFTREYLGEQNSNPKIEKIIDIPCPN